MFQNGEAVLLLLFLQVEHLPQLLQLLQLTEGLQHHQHDYQPQDQVHWREREKKKELTPYKKQVTESNTYHCSRKGAVYTDGHGGAVTS